MDLSYTLDANNRIVAIDGDWDLFADANGSAEIFTDSVLGKPLENFIEGEKPRRLWMDLLAAVRHSQQPLDLTFRCDSPEVRREFTMHVVPRAPDLLVLSTSVKLIEPLLIPLRPIFACAEHKAVIWRCSQCNRVAWNERWMEAHEAVTHGMTVDLSGRFPVSYTICPSCRGAMVGAIARLKRLPPGKLISTSDTSPL